MDPVTLAAAAVVAIKVAVITVAKAAATVAKTVGTAAVKLATNVAKGVSKGAKTVANGVKTTFNSLKQSTSNTLNTAKAKPSPSASSAPKPNNMQKLRKLKKYADSFDDLTQGFQETRDNLPYSPSFGFNNMMRFSEASQFSINGQQYLKKMREKFSPILDQAQQPVRRRFGLR